MIYIILFLIFLGVLYIVFFDKSPKPEENEYRKKQGQIGEKHVSEKLGGTIPGKQYLINDITFSDGKGHTAQIDHVFINRKGIWVIETKNYSGSVHGTVTDQEWTHVTRKNISRRFYNPIKQNETHIQRLNSLIFTKNELKSVVCFIKTDIKDIYGADNVVELENLNNYVNSNGYEHLSIEEMEDVYRQILKLKKASDITEEEHIANAKRFQKDY